MASDRTPPPMPKMPAPAPAAPPPVMPRAVPATPPPVGTIPATQQTQQLPQDGQPNPYAVPLNFWQHPWVQNVLPFVTSVMVHAALILLGLVFFGVYTYVKNAPPHQEEVIIPDASMINDGPPGGVPFQGLGNDPNRQALQDQVKDAGTPSGWAQKQSRNLQLQAPGGGEGDSADSIIGVGPGGGFGSGKHGLGAGQGDGLGGGAGDGGGPLAQFGMPGGGGIGPKGPVFGNGGNARKIAFVCDASGSMLNKFSTLRRELSKTVEGLRPIQSFNIIFFQEQSCNAMADTLVMATPENKVKAEGFLEDKVTPKGETNPIPALEKAFQSKPQLIYLLTDGDFPDNDAVLKRIRELERTFKVKINTIAFVSDADTDTAFMKLLDTIAKETGGVYKHVAENEL